MVTKVSCFGRSAKNPKFSFFFLESLDATATDRFDHTSTWRGGGRKGFFFYSRVFFYSAEYLFFFARRSFLLIIAFSQCIVLFLKKNKQLAELSHVSPSFWDTCPFFFFFVYTSGRHSLFFLPLVLPSFVCEVGGKGGKKTKVTTAIPRSTQTKILEP